MKIRKLYCYLSLWLVGLVVAGLLASCGDDSTPVPQSTPSGNATIISLPTTTTTAAIATSAIATTEVATTATIEITGPATTAAPDTTAATTIPATTAAPVTTEASVPNIQRFDRVAFAPFTPQAVSGKAVFPTYKVSANLSNVTNLADFKLSDAQKKLLGQNYFVVSPSNYKQFFQAYESFRYDQIPTYITTDSVTHVYHLLFDKLLRETEKGFLTKDLLALNKALFDASTKQYDALAGSPAQSAALRNVAFFAVASRLADPKGTLTIPSYTTQLVSDQLKLIDAGGGKAPSPVMGSDYEEDYSQYVPRGHYTKTEELKNYFRSMIWYGRLTFRAKNASETQSAILLTQAILTGTNGGQKASDLWKLIYEPTAFFVGQADDLTYQDYSNLIKAVYGEAGLSDPKAVSNPAKLPIFQKGIETLPPPKLNSMITYTDTPESLETQTKGLRVMGQRFTIDAYMFQNLVWRNVGTQAQPRNLPSGLDVFAVLGSSEAAKILDQQGATKYANYTTQFNKVKAEVAKIPTDQWTQNLYWSWVYLLQPLTVAHGQGYPAYMQNEAWQRKQLTTGLGSWTELKHDTLLYSKQIYAERGGGPVELPTGFVEPEPEFYARMAALAAMTRQGLQDRQLISPEYAKTLKQLEDDALQLKAISEKELAGTKLSDEDVQFIAYWGATIEGFTIAAADAEAGDGIKYLDKQDAAVVADVATGVDQVLEEGTGRVNLIYVAVQVNGKVILTQGAAYSQYQFTVPVSGRLTDEAWQQQLNDGKAPPLEDWKKSYQAAGLPTKQP